MEGGPTCAERALGDFGWPLEVVLALALSASPVDRLYRSAWSLWRAAEKG